MECIYSLIKQCSLLSKRRHRFTKKEKEYALNLRNAILSGTSDEVDYEIATTFWNKIWEMIENDK